MTTLYEAIYELRGESKKNATKAVEEYFTKYDIDKDGTLSKHEFIKIFQQEDVFSVFRDF
jgi:Ca2+-binding EF-hand superfamily protein